MRRKLRATTQNRPLLTLANRDEHDTSTTGTATLSAHLLSGGESEAHGHSTGFVPTRPLVSPEET